MMELEGGEPVPYRLDVDRGPGEHLVVHLMLDGRKAGQVDLGFTPENGGKNTLIIAKVESDGKVVREELAGTDKAGAIGRPHRYPRVVGEYTGDGADD